MWRCVVTARSCCIGASASNRPDIRLLRLAEELERRIALDATPDFLRPLLADARRELMEIAAEIAPPRAGRFW